MIFSTLLMRVFSTQCLCLFLPFLSVWHSYYQYQPLYYSKAILSLFNVYLHLKLKFWARCLLVYVNFVSDIRSIEAIMIIGWQKLTGFWSSQYFNYWQLFFFFFFSAFKPLKDQSTSKKSLIWMEESFSLKEYLTLEKNPHRHNNFCPGWKQKRAHKCSSINFMFCDICRLNGVHDYWV